jgi:hypothetical protein
MCGRNSVLWKCMAGYGPRPGMPGIIWLHPKSLPNKQDVTKHPVGSGRVENDDDHTISEVRTE